MSSIVMKFMIVKAFFDTNVIVYALPLWKGSPPDLRAKKAESILSDGGIVSIQVLNEFADVASRKLKLDWIKIGQLLKIVEEICGRPLPMTVETHTLALDITKRYGFRIYDSLILAAAQQAGCTTLYTEDMQHGQKIGSLSIVNPFQGK